MDTLSGFWAVPLGLILTFMIVPFVTHWLALFLAAIGKLQAKNPRPAARSPIVRVLLAMVFHPVPWLLIVGIPYVLIRLLRSPPGPLLWRFLSGLLLGLLLYFGLLVKILWKVRKIRRQRGAAL